MRMVRFTYTMEACYTHGAESWGERRVVRYISEGIEDQNTLLRNTQVTAQPATSGYHGKRNGLFTARRKKKKKKWIVRPTAPGYLGGVSSLAKGP